jgi:hypothetical protein
MKWQWLVFVLATALCWGAYVPAIHAGQAAIASKPGPLRAFLCVGIAYFATAVVVPLILIARGVEPFEFQTKGLVISLVAGILGAAGALCVILALKAGGKPIYVAPLVFGLAPIVNVALSMLLHPPKSTTAISPMFYFGIVLAAVGAGLVLRFKPA